MAIKAKRKLSKPSVEAAAVNGDVPTPPAPKPKAAPVPISASTAPAPASAPQAPVQTDSHKTRTNGATTENAVAATQSVKPTGKAPVRKAKKPSVLPQDVVHTEAERLKQLSELPSLKKSIIPALQIPVDHNAAPPAAPAPAIEPDPKATKFVDRGSPIPDHYGMDRLVALPRDAHWLFVYWELKGGALERLRFKHSAEIIDNSRWVLRVRTPQAFGSYLVDVDLRAAHWYLKVSPNTRFVIELGLMSQQGEFMQVLNANETKTPNPQVSALVDEQWMVTRTELEQLLAASGASAKGAAALPWGGGEQAPTSMRSELPRAHGLFSGTFAAPQSAPSSKQHADEKK